MDKRPGMMVNWGRMENIGKYSGPNREMVLLSNEVLKDCFGRNRELLKIIGLSLVTQHKELKSIYGLRININTLYSLTNGHRFKCGLLLLVTLKHYWLKKGYEFRIDCI